MSLMTKRRCIPTWIVLACLASLPGCGWVHAQVEDDVEEDITAAADDGGAADAIEKAPAIPEHTLELNLKVGDRFPLLKTVEHTLRQPAGQGWLTSHSTLEMLLSVTVGEIYKSDPQRPQPDPRDGQKRLQVKYHRVHFTQEVPGQPKVEYDSEAPVYPLPLAAQGYHGLKDNTFEFWLSRDNQIILDMAGFDKFIDRCLTEIPAGRRQQVRAAMAATSGADGIANFVDDSVGLLPPTAVREGDTWKLDRQVVQPVPMYISTRYTLHQVSGDIAEIDILGEISPSVTYGPSNQPSRDVNVSVRGGKSIGSCLLDLRTGLPVQSRVEQLLDMNVRMADGAEFEQQKSTLTTIRYFPEQGAARTAASDARPAQDPAPRTPPAGFRNRSAARAASPARR